DMVHCNFLENAPRLILNGASEQLPLMENFVDKLGFPRTKTWLVDCGKRAYANTKTQLDALSQLSLGQVILVTSWYHVPRVKRTAHKCLPATMRWEVIAAPIEFINCDLAVVRRE